MQCEMKTKNLSAGRRKEGYNYLSISRGLRVIRSRQFSWLDVIIVAAFPMLAHQWHVRDDSVFTVAGPRQLVCTSLLSVSEDTYTLNATMKLP